MRILNYKLTDDISITSKEVKIKKWDWLLVIGLVLAPMTSLRVWKIGPAELLCFIWSLKNFDRKFHSNDISRFFLAFISAMICGSIFCAIFYPNELSRDGLFTWIYLAFIAIVMYQTLLNNKREYNLKLCYSFAIIAALWYLFLYFVSIYYSRTPFGIPLWYSSARFTGGATNPHQIACLMCGLIFLFLKPILERRNIVLNIALAYICLFVELQTEASTGLAAIILGFFSLIVVITIHRIKSVNKRIIFILLVLCIGAIFIIAFYNKIYNYVYGWIASDRNGLGRLEIASKIGKAFIKSPLFGLGPGTHSVNDYGGIIEFHNTYLEILAATGLIGSIAFIVLTFKTIKKLFFYSSFFIPSLVAIYAYGFGGFAMRRLAYWGIFVFVAVISQQSVKGNKVPIKHGRSLNVQKN